MSVQRWRNAEGIGDEMYSLIYWREGLGVVYEGGYFVVESYRDLVRKQTSRFSVDFLCKYNITVRVNLFSELHV